MIENFQFIDDLPWFTEFKSVISHRDAAKLPEVTIQSSTEISLSMFWSGSPCFENSVFSTIWWLYLGAYYGMQTIRQTHISIISHGRLMSYYHTYLYLHWNLGFTVVNPSIFFCLRRTRCRWLQRISGHYASLGTMNDDNVGLHGWGPPR